MHQVSMSKLIRLLMATVLAAVVVYGSGSGVSARLQGDGGDASSARLLRFAAIGDSGTGQRAQWAVAKAMEETHDREQFSLVLMLGDNIYGGVKSPRSFTQRFEEPYGNLLERGVRFFAALGNHGSEQAETLYDKFNMGGNRYYTFSRGDGLIQFFALDSNGMDRSQLDWLERELSLSGARWKIAYFHHPIYSSGRRHGPDLRLRKMLEPLFICYGVNVVLSGHDHFYERLKPQQGIHYFVSGAAGKIRRGNIDRSNPQIAAGNDDVCHFLLFEATPQVLKFRSIGENGAILDSGSVEAK